VPGRKSAVDEPRRRYDAGQRGVLEGVNPHAEWAVHDACTPLLKQRFHEMPEPLVLPRVYPARVNLLRPDIHAQLAMTATCAIQLAAALPPENRELLGLLAAFRAEVAARADKNKMSAANLATCFAPAVVRAPEGGQGSRGAARRPGSNRAHADLHRKTLRSFRSRGGTMCWAAPARAPAQTSSAP
jgi:hypothetical protein